jgi:hypothetical protein
MTVSPRYARPSTRATGRPSSRAATAGTASAGRNFAAMKRAVVASGSPVWSYTRMASVTVASQSASSFSV